MTLEKTSMLTLSTAHLTPNALAQLRQTSMMECDGYPTYLKGDYGFFVYCDEGCEPPTPVDPSLAACVGLARRNGCDVICFDRDGPTTSELVDYSFAAKTL